jgi:hypothetical protein
MRTPVGPARARITVTVQDWQFDTLRLLLQVGPAYLMEDGTWFVPEGDHVALPEKVGLPIHASAVDAIHEAIHEYRGLVSDAPTEVRVLREWLASEQGRVQRAWDATMVETFSPKGK